MDKKQQIIIIILLLVSSSLFASIPNKFHGYAGFGNVSSNYLYVGGEKYSIDSTSNRGGVITVRFNNKRDWAIFKEVGDKIIVTLYFNKRKYSYTY